MKKIYLFGMAVLSALALNAQVTVTLKVDVTNYIASGEVLGAGGMRVGGNFGDFSATTGGNAVATWSPADASCAMTDEGNNIWSFTYEYPAGATGTQLFKFVNNDWGTNEGGSASGIATGGCGVDDGGGNINRTLEIPTVNTTLSFCYDSCFTCAGEDPNSVKEITAVSKVSVFPNPTTGNTTISYALTANEKVSLKVYDILGNEVASVVEGNFAAGNYSQVVSLESFSSGVYFYVLRAGTNVSQGKISKL